MNQKNNLWEDASPEETDRIIEKIASEVIERGMELPANLILGTFRPVSFIGGQMFRVFLAPFTPFLGNPSYEYISVLEKSENLKKLMRRIEELGNEREEEKKMKKKKKNKIKKD